MASSARPTSSSISGRRWRIRSSGPVAASVHPDAQPYAGGSGAAGVLLCHGFSGSTKSMIGWARHLEAAGFQVLLPRLPGHGTHWHDLNQTTWIDWYSCVDDAFTTLRAQCDQVFLAGLSMGAALCLRLAEQHGADVSGLTLVNPVINHPRSAGTRSAGLEGDSLARGDRQRHRQAWSGRVGLRPTAAPCVVLQTFLWADVRRNLDRVDQPLLVYRAIHDHVADPSSVRLIKAGVRSSDQTYIELQRSYHVATLDYDADDIFDGSVAFFRRLTKEADGTAE